MNNDKPILVNDYYVFNKTNNKYSTNLFTKSKAIEAEASNHKCKNCWNCKGCFNCEDCFECEDCQQCYNCLNSKKLIQCNNCRNCNLCYNIPSDFTEGTFSDSVGVINTAISVININDEEEALATFSKLNLIKKI